MEHLGIIYLLGVLVGGGAEAMTVAKCCPAGYTVLMNYGYSRPSEFQAGNLHCRPDPEAPEPEGRRWMPRQLRDLPDIKVELPASVVNSLLMVYCTEFELAKHVFTEESQLNITETGGLRFYTGGVEGAEAVTVEAGEFCSDLDFDERTAVVMTCACASSQNTCVQVCCAETYGQNAVVDRGNQLVCKEDHFTEGSSDGWVPPEMHWVPRSAKSLQRQCLYASLALPLRGDDYEEQNALHSSEESVFVVKHYPIRRTDHYEITKNGLLLVGNKRLPVPSRHYCLAPAYQSELLTRVATPGPARDERPALGASEKLVARSPLTTAAFYCDTSHFAASPQDVVVQSWFAGVGAVFSLLTVAGLWLSPELRRGPEGFTLMAHCLCMLASYTAMAVRPLLWTVRGERCIQLALVLHFLLLSAFFWLNIRAVIIFTRFRSLETMLTRLSGQKHSVWLLPMCTAYAVGVPALLTGMTAAAQRHTLPRSRGQQVWGDDKVIGLEETKNITAPGWLVPPDLDDTTCWFGSALGRTLYFTLPMGVVLLVNLAVFVSTITRLAALTRARGSAVGKEDLSSDKRRLILFGKMFVVMGLSWSGEFLAFANYLSQYYWHFSTAATSLRAVAVFLIFCCRKQVWLELRGACCCCFRSTEKQNKTGTEEIDTKSVELNKSTDFLHKK